ncbi:MAG: hypothetical protein R2735_01435 [Microthrixaceae bacterium]
MAWSACDRPVTEVCPTEWARMENRSVLQWTRTTVHRPDSSSSTYSDLMLTALHKAVDLIWKHHDVSVDIADIPRRTGSTRCCAVRTGRVFQVESRADGDAAEAAPQMFL